MQTIEQKYTRLKELYESQIQILDDYRQEILTKERIIDIKDREILRLNIQIESTIHDIESCEACEAIDDIKNMRNHEQGFWLCKDCAIDK